MQPKQLQDIIIVGLFNKWMSFFLLLLLREI